MEKVKRADFDIFSHIAGGADTGNFEALRETIVTGMIDDQSDLCYRHHGTNDESK